MKNIFKSFVSFTRIERIGVVSLCTTLLLFLVIRIAMPFFIHPIVDTEKEKKLIAAWETFKHKQYATDTASNNKNLQNEAHANSPNAFSETIDLNTADSAALVRLKGIGPVTAHKIILHRKNKGPFTNINQLKEMGRFSESAFEELKTHLRIGISE